MLIHKISYFHIAHKIKLRLLIITLVIGLALLPTFYILLKTKASAQTTNYEQGFEMNASDWLGNGNVTRVPSDNDGVPSSEGSYHAVVTPSDNGYSGPNSQLGGYSSQWPGDWITTIDTYLDPSWPVDKGFVYSVATNNTSGTYLRGYTFHAGVINDESTSNTNKLILIADHQGAPPNDTTFQIKHPAMHDRRVEITQAGWYTISHNFYNLDGRLVVDVQVARKNGPTIRTWTLDALEVSPEFHDKIPENVGGNRYGWFTHVTVPNGLAIDNITRSIGANQYNIGPNATDPVSIQLKDDETFKIIGATDGAVIAPIDIVVKNPDNNTQTVIPAGTTISAAAQNWDGTLQAPTLLPDSSVNLDDKSIIIDFAIKVGADTPLHFSHPVKLVLPGQAQKQAGYLDADNVLHPITTACAADPSITLVDTTHECYETSGNDLIVWTDHFSTFIAYSTSEAPSSVIGAPNTGLQPKNMIVPGLAILGGTALTIRSIRAIVRHKNEATWYKKIS